MVGNNVQSVTLWSLFPAIHPTASWALMGGFLRIWSKFGDIGTDLSRCFGTG